MPYRDDLELRRAHVRRLERELAELDGDVEAVSRVTSEGSWWERLLGGPRDIERRFELAGELDDEVLAASCERVFRVGGESAREGARWTWRAEPDPRPRGVEVEAIRERGRTRVTVRDRVAGGASYAAYTVVLTSVWLVLNLSWSMPLQVGAGVAWVATAAAVRLHVVRRARSRALDARKLMHALEADAASTAGIAVRVASETEEVAEVQELEAEVERAKASAEVA